MDLREFSRENLERCTAPNGFNHALDSWSLADWMVATMGELGEAANVLKKLNRVRDGIPGNSETPEQLKQMFADELADAFIYLDLTAQRAGVDLELHIAPPTFDNMTLSECMLHTMWRLGQAAGQATFTEVDRFDLCHRLRLTYDFLSVTAQLAGIDFPAAIRAKFDKTSAKIGYVR